MPPFPYTGNFDHDRFLPAPAKNLPRPATTVIADRRHLRAAAAAGRPHGSGAVPHRTGLAVIEQYAVAAPPPGDRFGITTLAPSQDRPAPGRPASAVPKRRRRRQQCTRRVAAVNRLSETQRIPARVARRLHRASGVSSMGQKRPDAHHLGPQLHAAASKNPPPGSHGVCHGAPTMHARSRSDSRSPADRCRQRSRWVPAQARSGCSLP